MSHSQGKKATLHSVFGEDGRFFALWLCGAWGVKKNSNGVNYNGQTGQKTDHFFHLCTPHCTNDLLVSA